MTNTTRAAVRLSASPSRPGAAGPGGAQPLGGLHSRPWRGRRPTLAAGALLAGLAVVSGPAVPAAAATTLPCGPVPVAYGPLDVPSDVKTLTTKTLRDRGRTATGGTGSEGLYVWWQSLPNTPAVTVEETFAGSTRVRVNPDSPQPRLALTGALRELTPKCLSTTAPHPPAPASPTSRATGRGGVPTATAQQATPTRPASSTSQSAAAAAPVSGTGGGPSLPWLVSGALGLGLAAWWAAAPGIGRRREQQTERENTA